MGTTKLNASQIELFISKVREHVADYRNRDDLAFIGGPRERQLLECLSADIGEYSDKLSDKVATSDLHTAVTFAVRIYRAYDPYSIEEDQEIYSETRGLVTYVLGKTKHLESLAAEHPGQYVWLVIAALMAVAGADNTAACQAASGYDTIGEAKVAGIAAPDVRDASTPIRAEAERAAAITSHCGALSRIESVAKGDFYPEDLAPIRDEVKNLFPDYNDEAVKLFTIAAFATAKLDSGSSYTDFSFVFNKKD